MPPHPRCYLGMKLPHSPTAGIWKSQKRETSTWWWLKGIHRMKAKVLYDQSFPYGRHGQTKRMIGGSRRSWNCDKHDKLQQDTHFLFRSFSQQLDSTFCARKNASSPSFQWIKLFFKGTKKEQNKVIPNIKNGHKISKILHIGAFWIRDSQPVNDISFSSMYTEIMQTTWSQLQAIHKTLLKKHLFSLYSTL